MRLPRRPLGATSLLVSPLGLSGSYGADTTTTERAFHELGVNYFFVTARDAEIIAGLRNLFRQGHRDEIVVATGARVPTGSGVLNGWEQMAKLLDTDVLDVFHLYWVQAHWYVTGKTWPAMQKLKEDGKARALSISCHDRTMARSLVDELSLDALMIRYNAAHRGAETEIFATLPERRPGVISYTATRWGRLLKPLGALGPMAPAECYRFVLSNPSVDVALCGAKSFQELCDDAAGALEGPLEAGRLEAVRAFGDAVRKTPTGQIGFLGG